MDSAENALMKRFILSLIVISMVLLPVFVQAQDIKRFASVKIDIWPEYDRPEVLVIYRIVLPVEESLPADISFRIPSTAGVPNAVAAKQLDGSLVYIPFDQQPAGDWSVLNFVTNSLEIQVEYYDPNIVIEGKSRHFEYRWPGDHAVDEFYVEVQQPFGATSMQITPTLGSGFQKSDGLIYYNAEVGKLEISQAFAIVLDYVKATEGLTIPELKIQDNVSIDPSNTSKMNWQDFLPWILGFLGVALLVGGVVWYWQTGRSVQPKTPKRTSRGKRSRKPAQPIDTADNVYCHRCGKRAQRGDRFCRACGTGLRANNN